MHTKPLCCLFLFCVCLLNGCTRSPPKTGSQHLRLNIYTEPPTLDSRKATDATSVNVLLMLFDGLTRIGPDHHPYPAIAKSITISPDGCIYTFYLREAYWSNGDPITADDFLYTWQKILDPKFPSLLAYKLYMIENAEEIKQGKLPLTLLGVSTPNARTLRVKLKFPTPYFLELMATPTFFPIHKKNDIENEDWAAEASPMYISNGPFILKKWNHESEIELERNPHYWDTASVKLHSLHLSMIDDTTTEFYMYEMEELDWAGSPLSNLPPEFIPALKSEGIACFYPTTAVYFYKINTQHFPLNNLHIRKALGLAIQRKEIVEHITQAEQEPATSLIPSMPGWRGSPLFEDGDLVEAKNELDLGLKELNLSLTDFPQLTLSYNTNREHQKIAQAIQQQWKDSLGISVQLAHYDWKVYLSKISHQDYHIGRMGWVGDFHDPVSFLDPFKYKNDPETGGNNDTGWEHPDYIRYLKQAEKELDLRKREALLKEAEALLISEMPIIPIYFLKNGYLKKPYVKGVYLSPLGLIDFKEAYIEAVNKE